MTKSEFLSELENALEGKLPVDEINEILADYSEIFDSSPEEAGSPAKIARKILEDAAPYAHQKFFPNPAVKNYADTQDLAPLSKRVAAYFIDIMFTSLVTFLLIFVALLPFSTREVTTWSEDRGGSGYKAILHKDNNGITTNVQVFDPSGNPIFKGKPDDFVHFLDDKKIQYPEDFKYREHVITVKSPVPIKVNLVLLFMILGAGNILNAFITWKFKGYTLGKKLLKIRVERIDKSRITFADALLRELFLKSIASSLTGGLLNLGSFIWACVTNEQKTVHDVAVKTKVVSVKE